MLTLVYFTSFIDFQKKATLSGSLIVIFSFILYIQSKNKDERLGDALIAPFGAPASLVQGTVRGITDLIDGKTTQGAQELKRQLPLVGIPIWKDDVNAFVRARF